LEREITFFYSVLNVFKSVDSLNETSTGYCDFFVFDSVLSIDFGCSYATLVSGGLTYNNF